jgi:nucleoside-diphosphate-sugar epimerase
VANCLVTGGLGFIGSHLVDRLISDGCSVTIVDDMTSNSVQPDDNDVYNNAAVERCRVMDYEPAESYEYIFHLASPVGPAGILKYAGDMGMMILSNTLYLAQLSVEQCATFVLVSTSEVYGKSEISSERDNKIVPGEVAVRTEYGVGKLLAEICVINKAKVTPLKYHIIRPFNVAGPRQRSIGGFVIPRFVEAALAGKPITVFGTGEQRRTFGHVLDIVDGIVKVAFSDYSNEIWNLGNPNNMCTIYELALLVKRLVHSASPIFRVDPKTIYGELYEEAFDKNPDITKARSWLSWQPRRDLEQIIQDVIDQP